MSSKKITDTPLTNLTNLNQPNLTNRIDKNQSSDLHIKNFMSIPLFKKKKFYSRISTWMSRASMARATSSDFRNTIFESIVFGIGFKRIDKFVVVHQIITILGFHRYH